MSQEEKAAPAIGASITMNLGGDRQIVLQTFYDRDAPIDETNAMLDRLFIVADRQKARYELYDLRDELTKHEKTLAQFEEDLSRVETDFAKQKAERDVQVDELRAIEEGRKEDPAFMEVVKMQERVNGEHESEIKKITDEGYEDFVSRGRTGTFVLEGNRRANVERKQAAIRSTNETVEKSRRELIDRCKVGIANIFQEQHKADAERDTALQNLNISRKRYNQEIERLEREIVRREAIVNGAANGS